MKTKVIIKVTTEEGRWCLNEIKGLEEGTIIEGTRQGDAIHFKHNGNDAVIWLGENCEIIQEKKKTNRLPKGYMMDVFCRAICDDRVIETAGTKQELLEAMKERGWSRGLYTIDWVAWEYNYIKDSHGSIQGWAETKADAIKDFWYEYNK